MNVSTSGAGGIGVSGRIGVSDRLERLPITKFHKIVNGMLFLSWLCEAIDLGGTSFMMPVIMKAFNLTKAQGGYYSSIGFLGMFFGSLIIPALSDKFGRKKMVIASMMIWGCAGLVMSQAPTVTVLFAARFFLGFGLGAQLPVAIAYISESVPSHSRGKYITLLQMFLPIGMAVAGLLTVIVLPQYGFRGCYFVEALPALMFLAVWKVCPESAYWLESVGKTKEADKIVDLWESKALAELGGKPLPPIAVKESAAADDKESAKISDLFTRKYAKLIVMCFFAWGALLMSDYGLTTWLTQLLTGKGFDVIKSTGFVTIGILGGIPAWFFAAWAIEKFGRKKAILAASIMTAVFAYFYGLSTSIIMVILLGILYQFGKYTLAMTTTAYLPELWETHIRATGTGTAYSFGRLGSIAGPIFLAWVMTTYGGNAVFYAAAAIALIVGIAIMALGPETKGRVF